MIVECRSDDSDLCHELISRYGFTPEEMHRAAERYHLGRSKSGKTIYWMIDELGICRDGHIGTSWVSQMLKSRCPDLAPYIRPQHCLFGLHLLCHTEITENTERATPNKREELESYKSCDSHDSLHPSNSKRTEQERCGTIKRPEVYFWDFRDFCVPSKESASSALSARPIGVIESERSAVILSEARPELLWLAYPLNLTVDLFEPLHGHTVTLFPRTDPNQDNYYASLEFADQVRRQFHLDFRVSTLLEDNATPAQKSAQIDLADFIFNIPQK